MIHKEKYSHRSVKDDYIQRTITGKVDDILHMKTPVELKHILSGVQDERRIVLIEGAPGAGKSSLSLNICKKWSTNEMFQEFSVVILVKLRDPHVQASKTIADLLPYCSDKSATGDLESAIMASQGEGILWVLDGWDEFPERLKKSETCLVRNLIYLQNHNSSVIVTSRPTSSVNLHPLVSRRIEILGFTPDELKKYFEYRLNIKKDQSKSVEVLVEKIKEYPEVHSSCYLPLHAGFIADTYLLRSTLPSTQYGIFETVVVKCISRNQVKQKKEEVQSLDSLPDDLLKSFTKICELAYKGMLENKIIFTEDDLPRDFDHLDLLQEVASIIAFHGTILRTYNFLHLSVQEFLAAQYLATKPQYEQYWLFRGLMEDDRCLPMLTFYAAKTKLSAPGIGEFVSTVGDRYLRAEKRHEKKQLCGLLSFVFKCICETEDPSLCKPLILALNGQFFGIKTIYDYYSLGSFLSLSTNAEIGTDIELGNILLESKQEEELEAWHSHSSDSEEEIAYNSEEEAYYISGIYKREVRVGHKEDETRVVQENDWNLFLKGLSRFHTGKCIADIKVAQVQVSPFHPHLLLSFKKAPFICLSKVMLTSNTSRGRRLSSSLSQIQNKQLLEILGSITMAVLEISNVYLNAATCEHIGYGLQTNSSLHELYIVNCGVGSNSVKQICEGLHKNKGLKILRFSNIHIKSGIKHISDTLKQNRTLQELVLDSCKITAPHLSQVNSLLKTIGHIRKLDLSNNVIGNKAVRSLIDVFQTESNSLHTLVLHNCGISSKASKYLLQYFRSGKIKTLSVKTIEARRFIDTRSTMFHSEDYGYSEDSLLELSIDNEGAEVLSSIIAENCHIQTAIIDTYNINLRTLDLIFKSLQANTVLKHFHVYDGEMSTDNFISLGESLRDNQTLLAVCIGNKLTGLAESTHLYNPQHMPSTESPFLNPRQSPYGQALYYPTYLQHLHQSATLEPPSHVAWEEYGHRMRMAYKPPQTVQVISRQFLGAFELFNELLRENQTLEVVCFLPELQPYRLYLSSLRNRLDFSSHKPSCMHRS